MDVLSASVLTIPPRLFLYGLVAILAVVLVVGFLALAWLVVR